MTTLSDPATGVFAITPADATLLSHMTRAIRVSGAGNVVIVCADGTTATLAFLAGETRPVRAQVVNATNTTATGIEGMY